MVICKNNTERNAEMIELTKEGVVFQETDAIVNAANPTLLGGGGVDYAIHKAAGKKLYDYFAKDKYATCPPGTAVWSPGFDLPAKYIIHTVGPIWHGGVFAEPIVLYNAYKDSLDLANTLDGCRSISFCCISTGVYKYPLEQATAIAIRTVADWMSAHSGNAQLDVVRFCTYGEAVKSCYKKIAELCKVDIKDID